MTRKNTWTYDEVMADLFRIFRVTALAPFENKTFDYYKSRLLGIFGIATQTLCNILYIGFGYRMAMSKVIDVSYICEHVLLMYGNLRYFLLYAKRRELQKILERAKEIWTLITPEEATILRNYERKAYYFFFCLYFNTSATIALYTFPEYINCIYLLKGNCTEFTPPFRQFWNIRNVAEYKMTIVFEDVLFLIASFALCANEIMQLFLIFIPCGFLKALHLRLLAMHKAEEHTDFNNNNNNNHNNNYHNRNKFIVDSMRANVHLHQKIMLYCEQLEKCMRSIYFVVVFATVYNMSFLGFVMLESSENIYKYITTLLINLTEFFVCNIGPEFLLSISRDIQKAAYFASFGNFQNKKKINYALSLMIMRAQKPAQMTAGGYVKLSIKNFGSMLRSAYSAFALMRNVKN